FSVTHVPLPLFLFFSMLPRPPSSTLFPYTTLFRSVHQQAGMVDPVMLDRAHEGRCIPAGQQHQGGTAEHREQQAGVLPGNPEFGDRKSTRLNSSHVKISYAVFCLKKKKKETQSNSI